MTTVSFTSKTAPTARLLQAELLLLSAPDGVINWTGAPLEGADLNAAAFTNKLTQLEKLQEAGVLVPGFCAAGGAFPDIPPYPGWLGRRSNHKKGRDFRGHYAPKMPDFYVEPLILTQEKRLHVFKRPQGAFCVIRTATKVPIEGEETHPWVRSHETGWKLSYTGGSTEAERRAATSAVRALGLDFGAVDIGTFCGTPLVLELNTCPGIDPGQTLRKFIDMNGDT